MFLMQKEDGGVYHKLTSFCHADFVLPQEDKLDFYLFPVSTMATGDFAAVMALAYRIWKSIDIEYATRALDAAKRAWCFLEKHPEFIFVKNPEGSNTGEYGDYRDTDERAWAAAELYAATGEEKYQEALIHYTDELSSLTDLGWCNMSGFAGLAILTSKEASFVDDVKKKYCNAFVEAGESLLQITQESGYEVAMSEKDFTWGSNMTVATRAMIFGICHILTGEGKYHRAVISQMDYMLGKNALGYSYISGYGKESFSHPHNRPTVALGDCDVMKGWVSGGPNHYPSDEMAITIIAPQTPPMRCYADKWECYSLNEITIYWNSPILFVLAYLQSL